MNNETKPKSFNIVSSIILIFVLSPMVLLFQNCGGKPPEDTSFSSLSVGTLTLVKPPQDAIAYNGDSLSLSAVVMSPLGGTLYYQWKKDGVAIAGQTSSTLILQTVTSADAGLYSLAVRRPADMTNSEVTDETTPVAVTVMAAPTTAMGAVLLSQTQSQSLTTGGVGYQSVRVNGYPKPSIQWYKDGTALPGETKDYILFTAVTDSTSGVYRALISNFAGAVASAPVVVAVDVSQVAPIIVFASDDMTATVGSTVTLQVAAAGLETPRYQWYKGNTMIAGATQNTLKLTALTAASAATYHVVATNSLGSASADIILTIK